jgi:succinate dehydrogenase / fumarate reductase cytochrome b subunit
MINSPSPKHFLRWFDPRSRSTGTWAFILNRITAIGLTIYLYMHLIMLGNLVRGPEAYNGFISLAKSWPFKVGEMLVIAGGIIHGLNGIRIALISFGIYVRYQKLIFYILMMVACISIAVFGVSMFSG